MSKQIERQLRSIANKKAKIDLTRLKILQHSKESALRNQTLKKEKDNIARNYQELKTKMKQFRDEEVVLFLFVMAGTSFGGTGQQFA